MLHFNKVCNIEDFRNKQFQNLLRGIFGSDEIQEEHWPVGLEDRKFWEIGMAVYSASYLLEKKQRKLAFGVGAGIEGTSFILTRLFDQVVATDQYGLSSQWNTEAPVEMIDNPAAYAGSIPFIPKRLCVRCMKAESLQQESDSCDFIYSSSSIEHMGSDGDILHIIREMARILRPGGILSLSTEFLVAGNCKYIGGCTRLFTPDDIYRLIVEPSGCVLVDAPSFKVTRTTYLRDTPQHEAEMQLKSFDNRLQGRWLRYPHIVLSAHGCMWTSIHIALRK